MATTPYKTIQRRLGFYRSLKAHHQKSFALMRFMAGDLSPIAELARQEAHLSDSPAKAANQPAREWYYEIDTRDIAQFRSNDMLLAGKILSMATNAKRGEIDFENMDADEAFIHKAWLDTRYGRRPRGCVGETAERLSIWDAMVGGLGVIGLEIKDLPYTLSTGEFMSKPEIFNVSARRCVWDITAKSVDHSPWFACWDMLSGWEIERRFGEGAVEKAFGRGVDGAHLDKAYAYWTYYDNEGADGTVCITFSDSDDRGGSHDEPLLHGKNPLYMEIDGYRQSMLPFRTLSYFALPDVVHPLGLAELAVRDQLDRWNIQKNRQMIIKKSKYTTLIDQSSIEPSDLKKLMNGQDLKYVRTKEGDRKLEDIIRVVGGPPDVSHLRELEQDAERGVQTAFGYNAFALGATPEGTNSATAAQAIVQRGDLTAGFMASRHVEFKADVAEMFLAAGAIYDDAPLTIKGDGGVEYQFGYERRDGPIGPYLQPGADIVVRESSFLYQSRAEAIQSAYRKFDKLVGLMEQRPAALDALIKDVLEAEGIFNTKPYLDSPVVPPAGATPPPGAAPVA